MTMLPPEKIHVQVKDRGTVLFNYLLGRSFYPITLDFEELKNEKNIIHIDASAYQKDIACTTDDDDTNQCHQTQLIQYRLHTRQSKENPRRGPKPH